MVDYDFDLGLARRVAEICGPGSAAAKALMERDRLTANGEDAVIIQCRKSWLVVPRAVMAKAMGR